MFQRGAEEKSRDWGGRGDCGHQLGQVQEGAAGLRGGGGEVKDLRGQYLQVQDGPWSLCDSWTYVITHIALAEVSFLSFLSVAFENKKSRSAVAAKDSALDTDLVKTRSSIVASEYYRLWV